LKQGFNPWAGKRSAPMAASKNDCSALKSILEERHRRKPWGGSQNS